MLAVHAVCCVEVEQLAGERTAAGTVGRAEVRRQFQTVLIHCTPTISSIGDRGWSIIAC
jgi:hypothetical protein